MDQLLPLAEVIGFDILAIGLLVIGLFAVCREIWKATSDRCFEAVGTSWRRLRGPRTDLGPARKVAILLVAAGAGMVMNVVADMALDSGLVRLFPRLTELGSHKSEDDLKQDAFDNVKSRTVLKQAFDDIWADDIESNDKAKAAYQIAYTAIRQRASPSLRALVDAEYLQVRILRALWAAVAVVLLVTMLGPWRRALVTIRVLAINDAAALESRRWIALWAGLLLFAFLGTLELWSDQSDRFYKKLFYSYVTLVDSEGERFDRLGSD